MCIFVWRFVLDACCLHLGCVVLAVYFVMVNCVCFVGGTLGLRCGGLVELFELC